MNGKMLTEPKKRILVLCTEARGWSSLLKELGISETRLAAHLRELRHEGLLAKDKKGSYIDTNKGLKIVDEAKIVDLFVTAQDKTYTRVVFPKEKMREVNMAKSFVKKRGPGQGTMVVKQPVCFVCGRKVEVHETVYTMGKQSWSDEGGEPVLGMEEDVVLDSICRRCWRKIEKTLPPGVKTAIKKPEARLRRLREGLRLHSFFLQA